MSQQDAVKCTQKRYVFSCFLNTRIVKSFLQKATVNVNVWKHDFVPLCHSTLTQRSRTDLRLLELM